MKPLYLGLMFAALMAAQSALPSYRASHAVDLIVVDGKLDEFSWLSAPRTEPFRNIRKLDDPQPSRTDAALLWNSTNLYVAFVCRDELPWGTLYKRDEFLWNQEVVEVFLDPDGDGKNYPELEVSPHNVVVDLLIPGPPNSGTDASIAARWDIEGLETAVQKHAAGWVVEMAIPWAALRGGGVEGAPAIGDRWRVGLYRIERPGGAARAKEEMPELEAKDEYLAWAPTEKSFHEPAKFGYVEFVLKP